MEAHCVKLTDGLLVFLSRPHAHKEIQTHVEERISLIKELESGEYLNPGRTGP